MSGLGLQGLGFKEISGCLRISVFLGAQGLPGPVVSFLSWVVLCILEHMLPNNVGLLGSGMGI